MRIIEIAKNNTTRKKAAELLSKKHRTVIESDTSSWESVSGYSDKYFDDKMTQTLTGQTAHEGKTVPAGLLIPENTGTLSGPYMKLMRGFYRATIWLTPDKSVTQFKVDVTSDMGVHAFAGKEVRPDSMKTELSPSTLKWKSFSRRM